MYYIREWNDFSDLKQVLTVTTESPKIRGPHPDSAKSIRRTGWNMLWQVADKYEWNGGVITPAPASKTGVYSPLAYPEMAINLARVARGRERPEDWIRAYGMLEWGSVRDQIEEFTDHKAESRLGFLEFADNVRKGVDAIGKFNEERTQDNARQIRALIEPGLSNISPMVVINGSGDSGWHLRLAWRLPTLKEVVMFHLAGLASQKEADVRVCKECDSFFVATHGKQRFCPAIKGVTWGDGKIKRESRCATRSRKRKHRASGEGK